VVLLVVCVAVCSATFGKFGGGGGGGWSKGGGGGKVKKLLKFKVKFNL
jgi:hypothetical protein